MRLAGDAFDILASAFVFRSYRISGQDSTSSTEILLSTTSSEKTKSDCAKKTAISHA